MYIDVQIRFFKKTWNTQQCTMYIDVYTDMYSVYTCVARAPGHSLGHSPGHTRPVVYRAINIVY